MQQFIDTCLHCGHKLVPADVVGDRVGALRDTDPVGVGIGVDLVVEVVIQVVPAPDRGWRIVVIGLRERRTG